MGLLRFFRDLRIRYKLLLSYSAIFILSVTAGSLVVYPFVRQTLEANIESELKNTTATLLNMVRTAATISIKNHLRAVAEKNLEIVGSLHRQVAAGAMTREKAQALARDVLLSQTIGDTGYIYCLSSQGVIVIHPKIALHRVNLSKHAFIRDQKKRKQGYLEYDWQNPGETETRPKALYMTYFKPWDWIISVSSYRSEFQKLIKVDDFRQSILSIQFGKTGYSYVIDINGNLIVHPKLEGRNYYDARDADGRYFIREICRRKSGKIIYDWKNPGEGDSRSKLVIFNYIPEFDWIVASSSYLEEFYAPLATLRNLVLATVVMSLLLVMPITLRLSASITNPIHQLIQRFSQAAEGNVAVRMVARSEDEVGQLARYFNTFMARLERYSQSLEAEISDRKRAEAAIRQSEAKYRELVQNANSIILRMDMAGNITFFNEFAQDFFGYEETEILWQNVAGTIVPADGDQHRAFMAMIAGGKGDPSATPGSEYANIRRNGERVWISWTSRGVADGKGQVTEYLCIGNDVTESRQAQQAVSRMRLYLKNIVDSMPSILVAIDSAEQVTLWNREAENATGISAESAMGEKIATLLPVLAHEMAMVRGAIGTQTVEKREKVFYSTQDKEAYFDIMVYPLMTPGDKGAVIRMDDVSARVRMEDMMVQTEKMMSVGGLAAGMAHEINNPLGGILQSAQNLARRLSPDLAVNVETAKACGTDLKAIGCYMQQRGIDKFVQGIRASGERAAQIVANMLNFSRPSESHHQPIRLADLLDKTVELAAHDYDLKKKYDFRHIEIVRNFQPGMPEVFCSPNEIEQVVLNLLRNAAQASSSNPRITLRLAREGPWAVVEVEDNGVGMDEKTRKRVFEPFFTTKDVGIGTGLGLSVSYFIVTNNHGGTMSVTSSPGKGSRFRIELPVFPDPGA